MEVKMLEIRDRMTYIPVVAIKMKSYDIVESYHLMRTGYGQEFPLILIMRLCDRICEYSAYDWPVHSRTMREAHLYVNEHFDELASGAVVDVEYILGETASPKESERWQI